MLLTLFLTAVVAGVGLWFYKRKQIIALTEQLRDKEAIITVLTAHVEPSVPSYQATRVKPLREGNEKNIKPAPTKPRPKAPAPQPAKPPAQKQTSTESVDGNSRRRRRTYKPKTTTNK